MKIEKIVPEGREILSFIIDTVIEEMKREDGEVHKKQIFISKDIYTYASIKEEIANKNCIECSENTFVVDWKEKRKGFTISISLNEPKNTEIGCMRLHYILMGGSQIYRFNSSNPEKVLIFKKVNTKA